MTAIAGFHTVCCIQAQDIFGGHMDRSRRRFNEAISNIVTWGDASYTLIEVKMVRDKLADNEDTAELSDLLSQFGKDDLIDLEH
jgi:hypothetical protein